MLKTKCTAIASAHSFLFLFLFYYQITTVLAHFELSGPTIGFYSGINRPTPSILQCQHAISLIPDRKMLFQGPPKEQATFSTASGREYRTPALFMSHGCMVFVDSVGIRTGILESTENLRHGPVEAAAVWAAAKEAAKVVVRNRFVRPSIDYVNIAYQQISIHLNGQSQIY